MRKAILTSLLLCVLLVWLAVPVVASYTQDLDPVIDQDVSYVFGEELTFSLTLDDEKEPVETWLYIQPKGMGIANFGVDIPTVGKSTFVITPEKLMLKPFTMVAYWYQFEYADGSEFVTDEAEFYYVDNRVEWQHTANNHFEVYWQDGNHDFGVAALNIAQQSWEDIEPDYLNAPQTPLIVYLYPSGRDLQEALALGQMTWVAGHADPQLNAILISVAPGPEQRLEMQRQIPHELAHLFTYASLEDGYINQPRWLLEGLASMAEAVENDDYVQALTDAELSHSLYRMESLCDSFPTEKENIHLAYAQSLSFTQYLQTEYGQRKLQELMSAYGEGLTCTTGFSRTYDLSMAQAQADWEQVTFGTGSLSMVWQALSPYLLLFVVLGVLPFVVTILRKYVGSTSHHE